jgi:hypothetical protein
MLPPERVWSARVLVTGGRSMETLPYCGRSTRAEARSMLPTELCCFDLVGQWHGPAELFHFSLWVKTAEFGRECLRCRMSRPAPAGTSSQALPRRAGRWHPV